MAEIIENQNNIDGEKYQKKVFVEDIQVDQEVTDYFMVKNPALRVGSNGKQYFDVTLCDKTGEVSSKKWDVNGSDSDNLSMLKDGDVIRIKARVNEWQGAKQFRLQKIRRLESVDHINMQDYIKAAPEDPKVMYDYIHSVAESFEDQDLKKLCLRVLDDNKDKWMYYPAASRNHHAEFAGLLWHVKRMLMNGQKVCEVYTDLKRDLVCAGVIVHDIAKIWEIKSNEFGVSPGYSVEGNLLGHIVMGIKYLDGLMDELDFPQEKKLMVEHMVLSHHYEPEYGSPKRPMFPEAEVLHYLDILDARLFDMFDALSGAEKGGFSEKVWTLDNRKIYKPEEE
ncbi:MAG: OB-fold nucleic acid binding domain-containing protein [Eubacteriales bacterium]|nr:OB-fold nucleic acid binding domain-containing protein [Eubacteriales bacterium]